MPHFGAPALLLLQLLAALPATAAETDATPLRFSVMESWSMPLVRLQRGQPIDGIVYDITRSLARQVGRKALYHPYPRGRIEQAMNAGEIDVRCYISPAWLSHDFPGYRWSVALLVQRDILVAREGFAPIPEALPAQRIGTVLGYSYPRLQVGERVVSADTDEFMVWLPGLAAGVPRASCPIEVFGNVVGWRAAGGRR